MLGIGFTHFSCDYVGETYGLKRNKPYRYLNRNRTKLSLILQRREMLNLCYAVSSSADLINDASVSMFGDVDNTGEYPYKRIYAELPLHYIERFNNAGKIAFLFSLFSKADEVADIQYGYVTIMSRRKLPALYFGDIGVDTVDKDEDYNLTIWLAQRESYRFKTRSVYWANLLGHGHLGRLGDEPGFVMRLKELLGTDNVRKLPSGKLFFIIPHEFQASERLRSLLDEHALVVNAEGMDEVDLFSPLYGKHPATARSK